MKSCLWTLLAVACIAVQVCSTETKILHRHYQAANAQRQHVYASKYLRYHAHWVHLRLA